MNPKGWTSRNGKLVKYHCCMRCGRMFLCPTSDTCQAGIDVLPRVMQPDGTLKAHCPEIVTWDYARELIKEALECTPAMWYGRIPMADHKFFTLGGSDTQKAREWLEKNYPGTYPWKPFGHQSG